jgi:hypothetical protein
MACLFYIIYFANRGYWPIVLQKSKVASVRIFDENLKTRNDRTISYGLSRLPKSPVSLA